MSLVTLLLGLLALPIATAAQPPTKPAEPPAKPAAMKLPDGTIILLTKSPDDVNPAVDGVLLSAQEYQALVEQVEQFKKAKENQKPQSPSACDIRGKIVPRGDRSVAQLKLTYSVQTTTPRCVVSLGCQRTFPTSAKYDNGKLPILGSGDDGLTVSIEQPGAHTISVEVETLISPRTTKGGLGFEIGLPRAAITTLVLEGPASIKNYYLGLRAPADRLAETRWSTEEASSLTLNRDGRGYPLGPIDWLEVSWDTPATDSGKKQNVQADVDTVVRIDESQIVTTTTFRLQGSLPEWQLAIPMTADVDLQRNPTAGPRETQPEPSTVPPLFPRITRPTDASKPIWIFRPPDSVATSWVVTSVTRQARPVTNAPNQVSQVPIGPYHIVGPYRQNGTVRAYAPPTIRVNVAQPKVELRRQDTPKTEDDLVALWRYSLTDENNAKSSFSPMFELTTRKQPGFTNVQPTYVMKRNDSGWRMQANIKVTPVRDLTNELIVEVPTGWQAFEAAGATDVDLVDEVQIVKETATSRQLSIRFSSPQKMPFELVLIASRTGATTVRHEVLPLLKFLNAKEQAARLTAQVPDGLEIAGSAIQTDGSALVLTSDAKATSIRPNSTQSISGQATKGIASVDLSWQPYRPELVAEIRADVDLQETQAVVTQSVRFHIAEGDTRPIMFTGVAVGLRLTSNNAIPLEQLDRDKWQIRQTNDTAKDFVVNFKYSMPLPPRRPGSGSTRVAFSLLWPDAVTKSETTIRLWGTGSGRRIASYEGSWRELPPEVSPERESWPWLTLFSNEPKAPISLEFAEHETTWLTTTIDRTLAQAWLNEDGMSLIRCRFLVRRWSPAGLELEIPSGVTPEILLDGRKIDVGALMPVLQLEQSSTRVLKIPLPDAKPARAPLTLDVRYQQALNISPRRTVPIVPPRLLYAAHRTPTRWQFLVPSDRVPFCLSRDLLPDQRWAWRSMGFSPVAGASSAELEQWFTDGVENETDSAEWIALSYATTDTLTGRQTTLGDVQMMLVPRIGWIIFCSVLTVIVGLVLARLKPVVTGLILTTMGVVLSATVGLFPQPTGHIIAGIQPGLVALVMICGVVALFRAYHQRQVTYLPGFTRIAQEPISAGTISHVSATGSEQRASSPAASGPRPEGTGSRPSATAGRS